jgi:hypothetical protein
MKMINDLRFESIGPVEEQAKVTINRLLEMLTTVRNCKYEKEDTYKAMQLWRTVREAILRHEYHFDDEIEIFNMARNQKEQITVNFPTCFTHTTGHLHNSHELFIDWAEMTIHPSRTELTRVYDLNQYYRNYAKNRIVNRYFRSRNYKLAYQATSPTRMFTPYVLQTLLAGAIGEEVVKAILQDIGLSLLHEKDYLAELFEIYDLELAGYPIYIDAKNYSNWTTLYRFSADVTDPEYDEKLNSRAFLDAAQKKWKYITDFTGDRRAKLVFINLLAAENHPNEGWNENLERIYPFSFAKSSICIIQGIFQPDNPEILRDDFTAWVQDTKQLLRK